MASQSFVKQITSLPSNFWYANFMEILERLAFFGVRAIAPLFLVASADENGLGLDFGQKGVIYMVWALIQCLLPMVSGGYTDRYGYRKSLAVAFVINALGYLLMAQSKPVADSLAANGMDNAGFWVFMLAACLVATGTAIFKPPCHGTVAKCTTEETSSMGWGVFYWVVNIGGALAPMCAAWLRADIQWDHVFYAAAIVTLLNFLPAFLLYKEPEKEPRDEDKKPESAAQVFMSSVGNIFGDKRLLAFLLIFSCFWLMFMQLWDLMPNFIDEWVNTSDVAGFFGAISSGWVTGEGAFQQTKPEIIINIDAIAIICFVIPISALVARINKVAAMIIGMLIAMVGFVGAGMTTIGWFCCVMVFVFAVGEMVCSPTFSAYVGLIAPADKKALYMGYSNIPFAIGWAAGNGISGFLYEKLGSKAQLARKYLMENFGVVESMATNEDALPKGQVVESLAYVMKTGDVGLVEEIAEKVGAAAEGTELKAEQIKEFYAPILEKVQPADIWATTEVLWDTYHPQMVWVYLGAIGLLGTIGMIIFYFATKSPATPDTDQVERAAETESG